MREFLEFEINIYRAVELEKYDKEEKGSEDMDDIERLIKGEGAIPVPPIPFKGKFFIRPSEVIGFMECISLNSIYEDAIDPKKDQLVLILKNGIEQPVNCTVEEYFRKVYELNEEQ